MADISDKSIGKLIDAVSGAVGVLYEPRRIRNVAKAEADAELIAVEGQLRIQDLLEERALRRTTDQRLRRQRNIEAILGKAADFMPDTVNEEPADEDWIYQFFGYCEDVSNETMQVLWAKILAGEVAQPGSFSLQTLDTVKRLRQRDAELFAQACMYVWNIGGKFFIPIELPYHGHITAFLIEHGLGINSWSLLDALGLLQTNGNAGLLWVEQADILEAVYCSKTYYVRSKLRLPGYQLTRSGQELYPLSNPTLNVEFEALVLHLLESYLSRC